MDGLEGKVSGHLDTYSGLFDITGKNGRYHGGHRKTVEEVYVTVVDNGIGKPWLARSCQHYVIKMSNVKGVTP
jgi:hypothetical protein